MDDSRERDRSERQRHELARQAALDAVGNGVSEVVDRADAPDAEPRHKPQFMPRQASPGKPEDNRYRPDEEHQDAGQRCRLKRDGCR